MDREITFVLMKKIFVSICSRLLFSDKILSSRNANSLQETEFI